MSCPRSVARWVILTVGVLLVSAMPSLAAETLTLKESVEIALERSSRVLLANSQERQSKAQADEARSMLLPNVHLSGGVERSSPTPSPFPDLSTIIPGIPSMPPPEHKTEANVTLSYHQVIWRAKETRLGLDQSELGLRLAGLQQEAERLAVITDVVHGYVGLLEAMSALEVSHVLAQSSEVAHRITLDRLHVGTATQADVLASEAAKARAGQGVVVAGDSIALARDALLQTIGLTAADGEDRDFVAFQSMDELGDVFMIEDDLETLVERALRSRVEVRQAEIALEAAKLALEQFEASVGPNAELTGMYAWEDGPALSVSLSDSGALGVGVRQSHALAGSDATAADDMWQIGAQLTWTLADGGSQQSRRQQLAEQVTQAELRLADLRSALASQLSLQYNEVVHALQDLSVAEQDVLESRARYETTVQQLTTGTATEVGLLQAKAETVRAQHGRVLAIGRLVRAHTNLAVATGVQAEQFVAFLSR